LPESEIHDVIQKAYIEGIHNEQDPEKVWGGFHPEFRIFMRRQGDEVARAGAEAMLQGVIRQREANPASGAVPVVGTVKVLDIDGTTAVVRVDLSRDGVVGCTDYLSLHRFDDGWKIVSKVYQPHM